MIGVGTLAYDAPALSLHHTTLGALGATWVCTEAVVLLPSGGDFSLYSTCTVCIPPTVPQLGWRSTLYVERDIPEGRMFSPTRLCCAGGR